MSDQDSRPADSTVMRDFAVAENMRAGVGTGGSARMIARQPTAADRNPGRHSRKRKIIERTLGIAFPIVLITLWQVAAVHGWIDRKFYPAPSDIIAEMRATFRDNPKKNWWLDIGVSIRRMLWGYFWGVLFGLFFGFVLGMSRLVRATIGPTLNALYTVPKLAMIGIFLLILGFDEKPIIAVVSVTVFFFVWIQTESAVVYVPEGFREAARSFNANRWHMFRHVVLPSALPSIFVGLRVAGGVAVLTLIGSEFVYAPGNQGIGYRINNARQILDPKQAYVGLVVAALLGVLVIAIIRLIGRLLIPWAPKDTVG